MVGRVHISVPKQTWVYLIILAVVIVGSIIREINLLIILGGLMFGPLWISWYMVRSTLKRLQLRRTLPQSVFPGDLFLLEVEINNQRKRLDSWGLIYDDRIHHVQDPRRVPAKSIRALVPTVPVGEGREVSFRCRLWNRGRYRLGPAQLSTQMPLGLLGGRAIDRRTDEFIVYPQVGNLSTKWTELVKVNRPGQRSWHRNQGQIEGDFYGLRDWRSGDCRRWIHWRSSAKRNELVVRQFEQVRTHDFIILLDLWDTGEADYETIERSISFVASVIAHYCRGAAGQIILGIAAEQAQLIRGPANAALQAEALEMLAETAPSSTDSLSDLLLQVLPFTSRDDQVVLVSTKETSLTDEARIDAERFQDDHRRSLATTICLNASDPSFSELFTLNEPEEITAAT